MGGGGGGGGGFEGGFQYLPRDVVLREHHGTAVTADYSDTLSREGGGTVSHASSGAQAGHLAGTAGACRSLRPRPNFAPDHASGRHAGRRYSDPCLR
jgi:hypothetical protein